MYKKLQESVVADVSGVVAEYLHHTGAKVILIKNEDINKSFNICFKTPVDNDKGIPHILEHTVLCGSKKYPVKEPFINLAKSSLQTYLNASTWDDHTCYPVASPNLQDFKNLVDVYLDAVFNPLLRYVDFMKEGWHVNSAGEYNGIVFNEMKGVFSSYSDHVNRAMDQVLSKSMYSYTAGGYPLNIVDLSYEEFCAYHKTHYVANNAIIYVYGDIDFDWWLNYLEVEYLNAFPKGTHRIDTVKLNTIKKKKRFNFTYPTSNDSDVNSYIHYLTFVIDDMSAEENFAFRFLIYCIGGKNSLLQRVLEEADLGETIYSASYHDHTLLHKLEFALAHSKKSKAKNYFKLVLDTLKSEYVNGIDKDLVQSALNKLEYKYKTRNEKLTFGIDLSYDCMNNMIVNKDVMNGLNVLAMFKLVKSKILSIPNYLEDMLKKHIIDNDKMMYGSCNGDLTLDVEERKVEKQKCIDYIATVPASELVARNAELNAFNNSVDTPEQLLCMRSLNLSDIPRDYLPDEVPKQFVYGKCKQYLFDKVDQLGLTFEQFKVDVTHLNETELIWLYLFTTFCNDTGTKHFTKEQFKLQTLKYIGSHNFNIESSRGTVHFDINFRYIDMYKDNVYNWLSEILFHSDYSDTTDLHLQLKSIIAGIKDHLKNSPNHVARALMHTDVSTDKLFEVNSLKFVRHLKSIISKSKKNKYYISDMIHSVLCKALRKKNLEVITISNNYDYTLLNKLITDKFNDNTESSNHVKKVRLQDTAVIGNSNVNYIGMMVRLDQHPNTELISRGHINVLDNLLSYDYLWNTVRVKGGAYGCSFGYDRDDTSMYVMSYRDPQFSHTQLAIENIAKYIDNLDVDQSTINNAIIAAIGSLDIPQTYLKRCMESMMFRRRPHCTYDERNTRRHDILDCTLTDLKNLTILFETLRDKGNWYIAGNTDIVNKHTFKNICDFSKI